MLSFSNVLSNREGFSPSCGVYPQDVEYAELTDVVCSVREVWQPGTQVEPRTESGIAKFDGFSILVYL